MIFAAGVPRSGSTWVYNAARLILQRAEKNTYACWVGDYENSNPADVHLVKVHMPSGIPPSLKPDLVLFSFRKPEDSVASMLRMKWLEADKATIKRAYFSHRNLYEYWAPKSDLVISFDEITRMPVATLSKIASVLGIELAAGLPEQILRQIEALRAPAEGDYDGTTLLHAQHVGPYAEDDLRGADVLKIVES